MPCLNADTVAGFADGLLSAAELDRVDAHLDLCPACRQLVTAAVAAATGGAVEAPADEGAGTALQGFVARGTRVGRFVILDCLGVGASGAVCAAYDPELDRKVALKLLRCSAPALGSDAGAAASMLREAKVAAGLSHPNIVAIHDVGTDRGRVFIAMELVEGDSLRERSTGRPWREILELYVQAGRGLAAAHAAGVVHRDFKPENVLVDRQGRVRVTDFGLARCPAADGRGDERAAIGTPCYMAPEQMTGEPADARADQFSFAVALFEALYGHRPFAGASLQEIRAAILAGRVRERPRLARVPAPLHAVLLKGLAALPERRFASMDAMLAALSRTSATRRARWLWLPVAGAMLSGALLGYRYFVAGEKQRCRDAAEKVSELWSPEERERTRALFLTIAKPFAEDAWRATEQSLEEFRTSFIEMRASVCEATLGRGDESDDLLSRKMACLHRRLQAAKALVALIANADATVVENAPQAGRALSVVKLCADDEALRAVAPPPVAEGLRVGVDSLRTKLAAAQALYDAGAMARAAAAVAALLPEARALGHPSTLADALMLQATVQNAAQHFPAAVESARQAAVAAEAGQNDELAAQAYILMTHVLGVGQAKPAEAEPWYDLAAAKIERLPGSEGLRAELMRVRATLLRDREGKLDEAIDLTRAALAILERVYGPESDHAAAASRTLGVLLKEAGHADEAIAIHEKALARLTRLVGPHHPALAVVLNDLGNAHLWAGDFDQAMACYEGSLKLKQEILGPDDPATAWSLGNIGNLLEEQGRYVEAEATLRRALTLFEAGHGASYAPRASALCNLGRTLMYLRRFREARAAFEEALAVWGKTLPPNHPWLAEAFTGIGLLELQRGSPAAAIPSLTRALELLDASHENPGKRGRTEIALAKALREAGRDRRRSEELVSAARDHFAAAGGFFARDRRELEIWSSASSPP